MGADILFKYQCHFEILLVDATFRSRVKFNISVKLNKRQGMEMFSTSV